ncbi:carbohydrate ABC transporter permease [Plantactinospora endophytica]|uniref:Bicyclomycin resistance protein n=1 Tax=Plantactinospora endophytica TaxID=673535 RepID=A0ABQ4EBZ4_9ACTN|nr:sugar ABC transporter permease [Plantactinospora endophytica]GIG92165.1 bicyclomycin resistance protein [Plantactinospora endophytica]
MPGTRRRRRETPDRGLALLAALALGLYLVFLVLPLLLSLRSSFTNENPLRATNDFVGLRNYTEMVGDEQLRASLKVTLLLAFGVTIAANAIGVGFAILLNRTNLSYRVMRTVAFLPQVLSGVIVGFVWQTILTQNGVLNTALLKIGVLDEPYPWLGSPNAALFSIGVVVAWVLSGFTTVVYLAALQSIPLELHDMASLDGVRGTQRFRMVTWPMIAPGTTISVTISLITVLKLYDIIAVLTAGGPANSTQSTALYIVKLAFTSDRVGYASAVAMLLLALSALVALTVTGALRRREVSL